MKKLYLICFFLTIFFILCVNNVSAQRVYSDSTRTSINGLCIGCSIATPQNAVDTVDSNYSNMNVVLGLLGAYAEQKFYFPAAGKRGDTVVFEVEFPTTLLDLAVLKNIYLETGNGSISNGDRSSVYRTLVYLRLLSGNRAELSFRATDNFDWAAIRMDGSVAGLLNSLRIYQVYYGPYTGSSTPGACNNGIAYVSEAATLCLACAIDNPQHVIDNVDSTYANMYVSAGALGGYVQETIVFDKASKLGDTITIVFHDSEKLLDASLLKYIDIATYNGSSYNFDRHPVTSAPLLYLSILNNGPYDTLIYVPNVIFDRVEIRVNSGIATLLSEVDLVKVCKTDGPGSLPNDPDDPFSNTCTGIISQSTTVNNLCVACYVSNPEFVMDSNPNNYSQLTVPVGLTNAYTSQTLNFPVKAKPGDSVVFLLGSSQKLVSLGLISTVTIRTYNGIVPNNDDTFVNANLLQLLSDSTKYTYIWKSKKVFDRIEVRLHSGLVGALNNLRIFTACLRTSGGSAVQSECEKADSTNTGTFGLCVGCNVTSPNNAIDNDASNYSTLNLAVSLLNAGVQQTVLLNKTACKGDSITIVIENPVGLLDATILGGTSIQLIKGNSTVVQTELIDASLLKLLPQGGNIRAYTFAADTTFDKIRLRISGGLVGALSNLRFYGVCVRPVAPPAFPTTSYTICSGSSITLKGTVPAGVIVQWFATDSSTTVLDTGSFNTGNLTKDTVFWAGTLRTGGCPSNVRVPISVYITNKPSNAVITNPIAVCAGGTVTITPQPLGGNFRYYADSTSNTVLAQGSTFKVGPLFRDTSFYVETIVGQCASVGRSKADIQINNSPINSISTPDTITLCAGATATITVLNPVSNGVYQWYNRPSSGTVLHTGTSFTTGAINTDSVFYVELVDSICGTSLVRKRTVIKVQGVVNLTLVKNSVINCFSDTVSAVAQSTNVGATIRWYANTTTTTPLATGATYKFVPTQDTTVIYAQASFAGCTSSGRLPFTVYNQGFPDGFAKASDTVICKNNSVTLTAESGVPGATIRWWNSFTNGTQVGTGTSFTTPNLLNDRTYYVDFVSPTCNSKARKPVSVTVIDSIQAPVPSCDSVTNNYIRFSWNTVVGAASYEVSIDGGAFGPANLAPNKHQISGLNSNEQHTIRVRATSICGSGVSSVTVTCTTSNCPPPPTPVCDSTTSNYIRFAWNPIAGAASYEVSINGGPFVTNNVAPNKHEVTGLSFNQPVSIRVRSVAPGCVSQPASVVVTCTTSACPAITANITSIVNVCRGDSASITISNVNIPNFQVVFDGNQIITGTTITFTPQVSRNYSVKIRNGDDPSCDSLEVQVVVNVNPIPTADFTFTYLNPGNSGLSKEVQFISNATGATTWFWDFGDGDTSDVQNPYHMYSQVRRYTVTHRVSNAFGCTNTIVKVDTVFAAPGGDLFIPNSFSPDKSGTNDMFKVYGDNIGLQSLKVFNQYGNLMFETNDINTGWNGEFNGVPQPGGVYIWTAILIDRFGNPIEKQGTVTLSRNN